MCSFVLHCSSTIETEFDGVALETAVIVSLETIT